jgi:D-serine deaminase-like pyridoxal phosphate-dependent protein
MRAFEGWMAGLRDLDEARRRVVAGGTPTFPIHARRGRADCSPGTSLLWDFGYGDGFPDLPFQQAAMVLTRIVSKPGPNRLCLDLGHKAIAAENPHPRVRFPDLLDAQARMHSEEHLVIESDEAGRFNVGDCLFGIPRHICPTVALFSEAVVAQGNRAAENWRIWRERRFEIGPAGE